MERSDVVRWLEGYVDAWRTPGAAKLPELFSQDIVYSPSPWKESVAGLQAVKEFWEKARAGADEKFQIVHEIVALDGAVAVVRVEVVYADDDPAEWRDLWILTFTSDKLCSKFEEWPFAAGQDDGQDF